MEFVHDVLAAIDYRSERTHSNLSTGARFHESPNRAQMLPTTHRVGSRGFPLHTARSAVVSFEAETSTSQEIQAYCRARRTGQDRRQSFWRLCVSDTISVHREYRQLAITREVDLWGWRSPAINEFFFYRDSWTWTVRLGRATLKIARCLRGLSVFIILCKIDGPGAPEKQVRRPLEPRSGRRRWNGRRGGWRGCRGCFCGCSCGVRLVDRALLGFCKYLQRAKRERWIHRGGGLQRRKISFLQGLWDVDGFNWVERPHGSEGAVG